MSQHPDLAIPMRDAIVADTDVTSLLPLYLGSPAVFTRRPVAPDAPYPMIVISPDLAGPDIGGLNFEQFAILRDIAVYGQNTTADQYRVVESLAYTVFDIFHRKYRAITVPGWQVARIWCDDPIVIPSDDDMIVGRQIGVTTELVRLL